MEIKQSFINLGQSIDNLELTIGWLKEAKTEKQIEMLIKDFEECGQSLRTYYENFKNVSTKDLAKELESRIGVQAFHDRLYKEGYNINITKKYSADRTPIELPGDITVLVIKMGRKINERNIRKASRRG
ncbi:hypothetical protein [Clostridium sp. FP1]|uniref:hypothetical protein n=1 Tax=Clostridium sp. FP1 TaxID=2724076 RepID=UPI0013E92E61|nr:hypothetical protein [Clostridium sp. FP1]MBZ9633150.1 hypothetical protein [Clostridium sp. FP1]